MKRGLWRGLFRAQRKTKSPDVNPTPARPVMETLSAYGLKLLYKPDGDILVDVIFVHGLNGDRDKTWTAGNAANPWPQTLLPQRHPQARILTFGYDATIEDWQAMSSLSRYTGHAHALLTELVSCRPADSNRRPIIFVAHSLGGLVCDHLLQISNGNVYYQNILECTRGILFLGTPHSVPGLARCVELLAKSTGLIKRENAETFTSIRRRASDMEQISNMVLAMIENRAREGHQPIAITCFFEKLPLPGIGVVVPMNFAILPSYTSIGIDSDHIGITKFENEDNPGFVALAGEVERWVKELN